MDWEKLKTVLWLRWRLTVNQWKKGGTLNAILGTLWIGIAAVATFGAFFLTLLISWFTLPSVKPDQLLLVWDVIVLAYLFIWLIGLVSDLQHGESLSLQNLLHLPVSPAGAFVLNYVASLLSLTLLVSISAFLALSIVHVRVYGWTMLLLPLLAGSFLFMITTLTFQVRSWLFGLMTNRRRRRTVIAVMTTVFLLVVQVPNIVNMTVLRAHRKQVQAERRQLSQQLDEALRAGDIESSEYAKERERLEKAFDEKRRRARDQVLHSAMRFATPAHWVLPIGWLPYGAAAAAEGRWLPGLLGIFGACAIGGVSLRFSYRATLRRYLGYAKRRPRGKTVGAEQSTARRQGGWMEIELPGLPGQASAVALASLRSLLRGPEGKMMLLSPVIILVIFGAMFFAGRDRAIPVAVRGLLGLGAIVVMMLSFGQMLSNIFATDRAGFRSYVLSPCPRAIVLLGKNVAALVLGLVIGLLALAVIQIFARMPAWHLLASMLQFVTCFLLYCLLGNVISIMAPAAVTAGSLKPKQTGLSTILLHVVVAMVSPIMLIPAVASWGIEWWVTDQFGMHIPIYALASAVELGVVAMCYRWLIRAQGRLLQRRETRILTTVTARVE